LLVDSLRSAKGIRLADWAAFTHEVWAGLVDQLVGTATLERCSSQPGAAFTAA